MTATPEDDGNEQNRQAPAKDNGCAPEGAGPGPGTFYTTTSIGTFYYTHTSSPAAGPGAVTFHGIPIAFDTPPPAPELEDGGIVVGEITAWRLWQVRNTSEGLRLQSVIMLTIWEPDKPMEGAPVGNSLRVEGVYAFKSHAAIAKEFGEFGALMGWGVTSDEVFLYGEVSLWGDVVEHEVGYRAQFARPKSLYKGRGVSNDLYRKMCGIYSIEPGVDPNAHTLSPLGFDTLFPNKRAKDGGALVWALYAGAISLIEAGFVVAFIHYGEWLGAIMAASVAIVAAGFFCIRFHDWLG